MYDISKSKMTDTDGMTLCATVVNRLEIKGEETRVKEILTAIRGECEIIDYGTMLPCPPVPEKEVGEPEREAAAAYLLAANPDSEDFGIEKLSAEDFKKISFAFFDSWGVMPLGESERFNIDAAKYGEKFAEIIKEFGCPTAQDWRRDNWGTLVNPVGAEMPDENTIRFFTYCGKVVPLKIFSNGISSFTNSKPYSVCMPLPESSSFLPSSASHSLLLYSDSDSAP